jgi:predicted nucleic acid-binding protein
MSRGILLDTGPLVAVLDRRDTYHRWAVAQFDAADAPLWTCEAVLAEACFLTRSLAGGPDAVLALAERAITIRFDLEDELDAVRALVRRYASVPMSLADACLVRMSELSPRSTLLTLDADFRIYRRNGRNVIPLRAPIP